jgi:hypothetical protein
MPIRHRFLGLHSLKNLQETGFEKVPVLESTDAAAYRVGTGRRLGGTRIRLVLPLCEAILLLKDSKLLDGRLDLSLRT